MNPYEILEIPPDASPEDIKAAYHRLAKQWHPDRFSGEAKAEAETRFRELAEAFSLLKDPVKRQNFQQQLPKAPPPGQAPGREGEAVLERTPEDWAAMAKEAFEAGKTDQAQALIHYAIRLDGTKASYHVLLAAILEREGRDLRAVVKALEAAIRLSPKDVESHLKLATHFHTLGLAARAQGHLQTAREIAPNHPKFRAQKTGAGGKGAKPAPGGKGKKGAVPESAGLVDQFKALWGRLTGKG